MTPAKASLVCILLGVAGVAGVAGAAGAAPPITFFTGEDIWVSGTPYRSSNDWLGFTCSAVPCSLEPATLSVRTESRELMYDRGTIHGQVLTFRLTRPANSRVIAWFRANPAVPWLKAGPVTTYGSAARGFKRPASPGTLELVVALPGGGEARLVPVFEPMPPRVLLQVRQQERRQMLGELSSCWRQLTNDYLQWSGDLDGDGRPDYLVVFEQRVGVVTLFLSSYAAGSALVGTAATYDPDADVECDGEEWLVGSPAEE